MSDLAREVRYRFYDLPLLEESKKRLHQAALDDLELLTGAPDSTERERLASLRDVFLQRQFTDKFFIHLLFKQTITGLFPALGLIKGKVGFHQQFVHFKVGGLGRHHANTATGIHHVAETIERFLEAFMDFVANCAGRFLVDMTGVEQYEFITTQP